MRNRGCDHKIKRICALGLFPVLIFLSSCATHDSSFSYFNMLDPEKNTVRNKIAAKKFWTKVRPLSTLSASHYKLGRYYQKGKKHRKAISEFNKAIQNDTDNCLAYNASGMSYDALGDCQHAHESYILAIQCAPDQAYAYNNYGYSLLICNNPEKASSFFRLALTFAGDNNLRIKNNLQLTNGFCPKSQLEEEHREITERFGTLDTNANPAAAQSTRKGTNQKLTEPKKDTSSQNLTRNFHPLLKDSHRKYYQQAVYPVTTQQNRPYLTKNKFRKNIKIENSSSDQLPSFSKQTKHHPIELSNGNGVTGMAARSAEYLRLLGFNVKRLTNADNFNYKGSTIYYLDGYQQSAQELANFLPGLLRLVKVSALGRPYLKIRILLGRDLTRINFPQKYAQGFIQKAHNLNTL